MANSDAIRVQVVYALPDQQASVSIQLKRGATVMDAVTSSGLLKKFPEAAARPLACAIFGRAVPLDAELRDGDRVELLRPLLIDPKQNRRAAVERSRLEAARSRRGS